MRTTPLGPSQIRVFRDRLTADRRALAGELSVVGEDLRTIEEAREIELEERSQEESAADVLARLGEREFGALREIEGALHRIEQGSYGICAGCSRPIAIDRLRARPSASLCSVCAESRERSRRPPGEETEEEIARAPVIPPELATLADAEIVALVRERFREEVGEALRGVRVVCRHGVVSLGGGVASDELRQIACRIVEDEIGLKTVDRLRVDGLAAETGRATIERPAPTDEPAEVAAAADTLSEDIFEVEEDGIDYAPPARPVAEIE
jgi:RNA polymerase-binding protein DksA